MSEKSEDFIGALHHSLWVIFTRLLIFDNNYLRVINIEILTLSYFSIMILCVSLLMFTQITSRLL